MNAIQLSLDIATSLSIIGAAVTFVIAVSTRSRKAEEFAIRQERIKHMSQLLADFTTILVDGDKLREKESKARAGRDVDFTADDYIAFCISLIRYVQINSRVLFGVWANDKEKELLGDIGILASNWYSEFMNAVNTKDQSALTRLHEAYVRYQSESRRTIHSFEK